MDSSLFNNSVIILGSSASTLQNDTVYSLT